MLLKLIAFELRMHGRQTLFYAAVLIYFLLGMMMGRGTPGGVLVNSPFAANFLLGLFTMASVVVTALFAGTAILRDGEYKMEGILFTTGLTRGHYVLSRYLGLIATVLLCLCAGAAGLYAGRFLPWIDPSRAVGYSPAPYVWALLFFAVPNVLVGGSIIFATAALTKNSMATYLSGVLLYVLYIIGSMLGNSPLLAASSTTASSHPELAALLEPWGLVAFFEQTRYWTLAQKNTVYLALEGSFLFNRLMWTGFSLSLFALTYRFFDFRLVGRVSKQAHGAAPQVGDVTHFDYGICQPAPHGFLREWRNTRTEAKIAFKSLVRGFPFYGLILLWGMLVFISVTEAVRRGEMGVPNLPYTALLLEDLHQPLLLIGALVMVFYACELVFAARAYKMDGILDATPTGAIGFALGRLIAIGKLLFTLISLAVLVAVSVQLSMGYTDFQWALYGSFYFRIGGPLLAVAVLSMTIANFMPNKYAGMGLSFLSVIFFSGLLGTSLTEHPLLRFAYTPAFLYSPMAGMAYHDTYLVWLLAFWGGISGLLVTLTLRYWRRGLSLRATQLGTGGRVLAAFSLCVTLLSGVYLLQRLHGDQTYRNDEARKGWAARYETNYGKYEGRMLPDITDLQLQVDLFPQERRYRVRGEMVFKNNSEQAMVELLVGFSTEVGTRTLHLRGATEIREDAEYAHHLFRFDQALQPGETAVLAFDLEVVRSAFMALNGENYVLPTASYMEVDKVLPYFGVNEGRFLQNPQDRVKRGLPPRTLLPNEDDHLHESGGWISREVTISGKAGQALVMPGELQREWEEGGRHYAHYRSSGLVPQEFAIAAANYESRKRQAGDVQVEAYYHKGHEGPVEAFLTGAAATLAYGSKHFSPYDDAVLRVAEIPSFSRRFGATAYKDTLFAVENRAYLLNMDEGGRNNAKRLMGHEIGHHWWGKRLTPAYVAGYAMLTELLAVYTETVITEPDLDPDERSDSLEQRIDLYFYHRSYAQEVEQPLSKVQFQPYVYYFKGAQVVHALKILMGETAINEVLSQFLAENAYPQRALARDLSTRLIDAAPQPVRDQVRELLTEVVTYHFHLHEAIRDGAGGLEIRLSARKTTLDATGMETSEDYVGPLEIGYFREGVQVGTDLLDLVAGRDVYSLPPTVQLDELRLDPRRLRLDSDPDNNRCLVSDE